MDSNEEEGSLLPTAKDPGQRQHLHQHDALQPQAIQQQQQQPFIGFGVDPNWGGFIHAPAV